LTSGFALPALRAFLAHDPAGEYQRVHAPAFARQLCDFGRHKMAAGFPAGCDLVAKFRAFAENQRGGFKQGCAVSEPQAAGKKPLPVAEAKRDQQPVKRAYLCHKPCVSKSARFLARVRFTGNQFRAFRYSESERGDDRDSADLGRFQETSPRRFRKRNALDMASLQGAMSNAHGPCVRWRRTVGKI